jgi:hypothetical protein
MKLCLTDLQLGTKKFSPPIEKPPVLAPFKAQPPAMEVEDRAPKPPAVIMATPNPRVEQTVEAMVTQPPEQEQPPPAAVSDAIQMPVREFEERIQSELDNVLSDKLMLLVEECTVMSSLKLQQAAAKRTLKRAHADYVKFKPQHAKFPATKESQTLAVAEAEKAYKQICDAIQKKEISLKKLAREIASSIVPSILASGNFGSSADNEEIAGMKKTCEGFAKLLEDQKQLLSEQQKMNQKLEEKCQKLTNNFEELEKKHSQLAQNFEKENSTMKEEIKTLKSHTTLQLEGVSKQVTATETSIQSLKNGIVEVKKSAATQGNTQESTNFNQRLTDLEKSLGNQISEHSDVKSRLSKLESSSANMNKEALALEKKCDQTDTDSKATAKKLLDQADTQKGLASRLTQAEQKAIQTEGALADRIRNLESKAKLPAPAFKPDYTELIKAQIDPLKAKLIELTNSQSQAVNTGKSYDDVAFVSLQKDVVKLSGDVKMLKAPSSVTASILPSASGSSTNNSKSPVENVNATPIGQTIKAGDDLLHRRVTVIEKTLGTQESSFNTELASIKERINNIEQRPVVQTPIAAPIAQQLPSDIESRLTSLENLSEGLQDSIDGLTEHTGEVVGQTVKAETASLHKLQKDNTDSLRTSIESLKSDFEISQQETQRAFSNVVGTVINGATANATRDVLNHINTHNVYAQTESVNNALNALKNEIDSHTHSLENLTSRFENINTGHLHNSICNTVIQEFPNLRDSEARLASLQTSVAVLQAVEPKLVELEKMVSEHNGSAGAPGGQGMRTEIDNIIQEAAKTQALQEETAEELKELRSIVRSDKETTAGFFEKCFGQITDMQEGLTTTKGEFEVEKTSLASQVEKLESQVEKLENNTLTSQVEKLECQVEKLEKVNVERGLKEKATDAQVEKLEKANVERSLKEKATGAQVEKLEKANIERSLKEKLTEAQIEKLEKANLERSLKERSSVTPAPACPEPSGKHISPTGSFSSINRSNVRAPKPGTAIATTAKRPPSSGHDRNRVVSQGTKRQHKSNGTPNGRHSNSTGSPVAKRRRRDNAVHDSDSDPDFDPEDGGKIEAPTIHDSEEYSDE